MGSIFAFLYIFTRFLIPPVFLIINLINIFRRKKILSMAGNIIELKRPVKGTDQVVLIGLFTYTIALIILIILSKDWLTIIILISVFLLPIIIFVNSILYRNVNGVYMNGIIFNEYLNWEQIHSYKWLDENTISFLTVEGFRIDFKINNKSKMKEVIAINKIVENNN